MKLDKDSIKRSKRRANNAKHKWKSPGFWNNNFKSMLLSNGSSVYKNLRTIIEENGVNPNILYKITFASKEDGKVIVKEKYCNQNIDKKRFVPHLNVDLNNTPHYKKSIDSMNNGCGLVYTTRKDLRNLVEIPEESDKITKEISDEFSELSNCSEELPCPPGSRNVITMTTYQSRTKFAHEKKINNLLYGTTAASMGFESPIGDNPEDGYLLTKSDK